MNSAKAAFVVIAAVALAAAFLVTGQIRSTEAQGTFTLTVTKLCGGPMGVSQVYADFGFTMADDEGIVETAGPLSCPEGGVTSFTTDFSDEETWTLTETNDEGFPVSTLAYRVSILCGTAEDDDAFGTNDDPNNGIFDPDPPFIELSEIPAGTDVQCTVINNLALGSLVVTKLCNPDVVGLFTFEIDGPDVGGDVDLSFALPCGGQSVLPAQGFVIAPGTITLAEDGTQQSPFVLDDFEVSIACGSPGSNPQPDEGALEEFEFPDNENAIIVCEVFNELPAFTLTVLKQCDPDDIDDEFTFQVETDLAAGTGVNTPDPIGCGEFVVVDDLNVQDHTLREIESEDPVVLVTGYDVTMFCTGDEAPTEGPTREFTVDDLGTPVFCIITNSVPTAGSITITVQKACVGEGLEGPFTLELETPEPATIPFEFDGCTSEAEVLEGLPPGTYTLTETGAGNAAAVSIDCITVEAGDLVGSVLGASFTFEADENLFCFVVNADSSFVGFTLEKECSGAVSGPFEFLLTGEEFDRGNVLECGDTVASLLPGGLVLTVEETDTGGAAFTSVDCGAGVVEGTSIEVTLTAATTCRFTNADAPPGGQPGEAVADVGVTVACTPPAVLPGANFACQIDVANLGPGGASSVSMTTSTPPGTTLVSFAAPAGWMCETPPVGGAGEIFCDPDMAAGETATFTLVLSVHPGLLPGTQIVVAARVDSETEDPNPDNDDAAAAVLVLALPINLDLRIDNENNNTIGIGNDNVNNNANDNDNANFNENANENKNDNENSNEQDQTNDQGQDNANDQTNNIDSSPSVNIKR